MNIYRSLFISLVIFAVLMLYGFSCWISIVLAYLIGCGPIMVSMAFSIFKDKKRNHMK